MMRGIRARIAAYERQKIASEVGRNDGEKYAAHYLRRHGYRLAAQNFALPYAEIDIIAQKGDILAFVEVKHRTSLQYGRPGEFVTAAKQQKIRKAAMQYLQMHHVEYRDARFRFDVIEVIGAFTEDALPALNHIPNAF